MATILENIQKARFLPTRPLRDDLPTFQGGGGGKGEESHLMGLRKRLSSFSGKIQPISTAKTRIWRRRPRDPHRYDGKKEKIQVSGGSDVSTYDRYRVYGGGSFHSFGFVGAM
ncbi:hypothetical protein TRIUR3_06525 [Triticum urartu]|uniref:Uncharacterized protein n=1 Tax=Triticum urartu TaxID=4572 RepID=M7YF29_TRIUA|nr:hypothetical protein TRIUR3_06525 [Triticum urartu]